MAHRTVNSLLQLFKDIDAIAPQRSKVSDGTIGDEAHKKKGDKSDHNPDKNGVIRAIDVTHDPAHGADMAIIAEQIRLRRDPRAKYVIFNHRIASVNSNWEWKKHKGDNPHEHHMHVSAVADDRADDASRWNLRAGAPPKPVDDLKEVARIDAAMRAVPFAGEFRATIRSKQAQAVQWRLIAHAFPPAKGGADGEYGPVSAEACIRFQQAKGLPATGVVDKATWNALGLLAVT
jgi:hypothetical protein